MLFGVSYISCLSFFLYLLAFICVEYTKLTAAISLWLRFRFPRPWTESRPQFEGYVTRLCLQLLTGVRRVFLITQLYLVNLNTSVYRNIYHWILRLIVSGVAQAVNLNFRSLFHKQAYFYSVSWTCFSLRADLLSHLPSCIRLSDWNHSLQQKWNGKTIPWDSRERNPSQSVTKIRWKCIVSLTKYGRCWPGYLGFILAATSFIMIDCWMKPGITWSVNSV